jgi:hypothetical protein
MASTSFIVDSHRVGELSSGMTPYSSHPQWPQRLSEAQRTSVIPLTWKSFSYDTIPCGETQIRRLLVSPGVLGEPIFTEMIAPYGDFFPYHSYSCLSYMWGESVTEYEVILNGRSFHVRKNLYQFLRMASRHPKHMRSALWIDAMCIDQNNDVEKGHQVKRMGDIYRLAIGSNRRLQMCKL